MLPFSQEQFISVFVAYNQAIWPTQIVAYALGAFAVFAVLRPRPWSGRLVAAILAVMWLWTGIAYHWMHFFEINKAAALFGAAFAIEAGLLSYHGLLNDGFQFERQDRTAGAVGFGLILYAMILYPLLGALNGHVYPAAPIFGVTPCPTTIFTFGILVLTLPTVPWWLLVVPLLWAVVGGSAAVLLGVPEDWMLLAAGVLAAGLLARRRAAF